MSIQLLEPAQQELDEAIAWYPLNPQIRRCRLSRFPYSVIYGVEVDNWLMISIAHQRRKHGYWRNRSQKR